MNDLTKISLQAVIKSTYCEIQAMIFLGGCLLMRRFFLVLPHREGPLVLGKGLFLEESVCLRPALHLWCILLIII